LKRLIVALTAALCVALPATAGAAGTLDQQQTTANTLLGIDGSGSGG
jgi:hypothetical protein